MATFPPIEEIEQMTSPFPTLGELLTVKGLTKLFQTLDDVEIFFQPRIGRGRADIVILRKGYGCSIIEVKDWVSSSYMVEAKPAKSENTRWYTKNGNHEVFSPHTQVSNYKHALIEESHLGRAVNDDFSLFGAFSTILYFSNTSPDAAKQLKRPYINCYGRGSFSHLSVQDVLKMLGLDTKRTKFDDGVFNKVRFVLRPPTHPTEPVLSHTPSKRQLEAAAIPTRGRRKIRGVAGSGKTYVAGLIAAEAAAKHKSVLIAVYNNTAKWATKDVVNRINATFARSNVVIDTVFGLAKPFKQDREKLFMKAAEYFGDAIEQIEDGLRKSTQYPDFTPYDLIIVDEAQDMRYEWIKVLEEDYLDVHGSMVVIADEGQNIYGNQLEDRRVRTPISGPWFRLTEHKRSHPELAFICDSFRKQFLMDEEPNDMPPSLGFAEKIGSLVAFQDNASLALVLKASPLLSVNSSSGTPDYPPMILARTQNTIRVAMNVLQNVPNPGAEIRSVIESEMALSRIIVDTTWQDFLDTTEPEDRKKPKEQPFLNGSKLSANRWASICTILQDYLKHYDRLKAAETIVERFHTQDRTMLSPFPSPDEEELFTLIDQLHSLLQATDSPNYSTERPRDHSRDLLHVCSFKASIERNRLKNEVFHDDSCIALSTVHSSKGIERQSTIILVDQGWDSKNNGHELLYTALTRARERLHVIYDPRSPYAAFFQEHLKTTTMQASTTKE